MTISLAEGVGKVSGVDEKTQFGRIIVLASIASIIAINAVGFFLSTSIRLHQYLFSALIVLICCQLYIGSRWAKWAIGFILVIYGIYGIYQLLSLSDFSLNLLPILLSFLTIVSLISGISLISSKSVLAFLDEQFTNRSIVIIRVLKALWLLLLMGFLVLLANDIKRIFIS